MDGDQLEQIFHSLKSDLSHDVIETSRLVDFLQKSAIDCNQEIEHIVHCFDPTKSGAISWANFTRGIAEISGQSGSSFGQPPVESSSLTSSAHNSFAPIQDHHHQQTSQSLLCFEDHDSAPLPAANFEANQLAANKYSDDLTLLNCFASSAGSDSMSTVESKLNNDLTQMEEHYEFTPSPESVNVTVFKKDDDDPDEDINYSNGDNSYNSLKSANFQQRNTWFRSSIRRNGASVNRNSSLSPYTSASLSRRSSLSYESDEMNNDANLEEDVQNMNDKLKKLQEQIEILTEAQMKNDVKYTSMKRENVNLNNKINYLEEQIRDFEIQSDERKVEDDRRFKDSMARLEREKAQELENYVNRILALQKELFEAKEESKRHLQTIESLHDVKSELESQIHDKELEVESLTNEIDKLKDVIRLKTEESHANSTLIEALNHELNANHQSDDVKKQVNHNQHESELNMKQEFENQLRILKEENRSLKESNEELTAQLLNNHLMEGKSLLKEGEAISSLASEISDLNAEQLKTTLKEQQDVNAKLRSYIDGILLNIVENYPQLLEVKHH